MTSDSSVHLHYPVFDSPGEWRLTAMSIIYEFGAAAGAFLDAKMRPDHGAGWVDILGALREEKYSLFDVGFVIKEPLWNPNSPVRAFLPSEGYFYNRMEVALGLRNDWIHCKKPLTRQSVLNLLDVYQPLSAEWGLNLPPDYKKLREAIKKAPDRPIEVPAEMVARYQLEAAAAKQAQIEAEDMLRQAETAKAQAAADLDELVHDIEDLESRLKTDAAHRAEIEQELAAQQSRLAAAQERRDGALARLNDAWEKEHARAEELAAALADREAAEIQQAGIDPDESPYNKLEPGDSWPGEAGKRIFKLSANTRDLFDDEVKAYMGPSNPNIYEIAEGWLKFLPKGGQVYVADGVFASANVRGKLTYIGRLDGKERDRKAVIGDPVFGDFRDGSYRLTDAEGRKDLVEETADWSLVNERGEAGQELAEQLWSQHPQGGIVSVTVAGLVAVYQDETWICIGNIADESSRT